MYIYADRLQTLEDSNTKSLYQDRTFVWSYPISPWLSRINYPDFPDFIPTIIELSICVPNPTITIFMHKSLAHTHTLWAPQVRQREEFRKHWELHAHNPRVQDSVYTLMLLCEVTGQVKI